IILLFITILLLTLTKANPIPPFYTDESGNKYTPVVVAESGIGGVPVVETYEQKSQCPVVFERDPASGKPIPFYGKPDENGYIQKANIQFNQLKPQDAQAQGITCGVSNVNQIRPRPPQPIGRWAQPINNLQRLRANAQMGIGVYTDPRTGQIYYQNPTLQQGIDQGTIKPPRLPYPKPTIIPTGQVVFDASQQKQLGIVVIPVQFSDQQGESSQQELNDKFFGSSDSFKSYYSDQSYNSLDLTGSVLPKWYTLSQTMGYYGDNNEANVENMITEAITAADADIDFSQYDLNKDGIVDGLFVVHAGEADESSPGNGPEIWSHYFSIDPITVDGVQIIDYETVSENSPAGIIEHEFGHYLGLPDLYDTDSSNGDSKGVGEWSIMGYGGYTDSPESFDPWSKAYLSWLDEKNYKEITQDDYYDLSADTESSGIHYLGIPLSTKEFFLVENRHTEKILDGSKAGGILIWHIDENIINQTGSWNGCSGTKWDCNVVNGDAKHKLIDVVEADGKDNLDSGDLGEDTDPWYKSCGALGSCQQDIFSKDSKPGSYSYDQQKAVYVQVTSAPGNTMKVGVSTTGTPLTGAPAAATASSGSSAMLWIILIIVILLGVGGLLTWIYLRKRKQAAMNI
ncbi:M6 family metalloprotease domain-containing protein, partial [Candidatus Woesearchaeota archaeon]|nr:M6 family metalloprotease domain-containing protein [Candidatus Woesearchaeota archaeon]